MAIPHATLYNRLVTVAVAFGSLVSRPNKPNFRHIS